VKARDAADKIRRIALDFLKSHLADEKSELLQPYQVLYKHAHPS
jgi:hypothetical protein